MGWWVGSEVQIVERNKKIKTQVYNENVIGFVPIKIFPYKSNNQLQGTLVATAAFVPKNVAIKINLLLYIILIEQICM